MNYKTITFAEYTPDQPDFVKAIGDGKTVSGSDIGISGRGAMTAKNVTPHAGSYKGIAAPVALTNALDARARGSYACKDQTSKTYNFTGTASNLYSLSGATTFVSTSKTGGYNLGSEESWEFVLWGGTSDLLIATGFNDNPQVLTLGSPPFADLGGSPPRARHIAVVRDFVVLGNVVDSVDGTVPDRLWWSAINDPTDWTQSAATQCDYQSLPGNGGWIQKIIGGEYGIIFQENNIIRMTYIGSPLIFRFDVIQTNLGTPAPNSVIKVENVIYYLSTQGFHALTPDGISTPIGIGKVDSTFRDDTDDTYDYRITATVDRKNKLILWGYPGAGATAGTPNKILVYNYVIGKWSIIETDVEWLADYRSMGMTLEELDTVNTNIDALLASLDAKTYMGGALTLGAFGTDHKLYTFTGTAMDAVLETDEQSYYHPDRSRVNEVWPLVEGASSVTTALGQRGTLGGTVTWGSAISLDSLGKSNVRGDARYHRHRVTITGGFNNATGVRVGYSKGGLR